MDHDKCSAAVTGIAQHAFQIHDVALRKIEVVSDADGSMYMHRIRHPAAKRHEKAENKVLKRPVVFLAWNDARNVALINFLRLFAGGIGERRGPEVRDLKLHGDGAFFPVVREDTDDELEIVPKLGWQPVDALLLHPAMQHFLLERNKYALIRVSGRLTLVVKRPHK